MRVYLLPGIVTLILPVAVLAQERQATLIPDQSMIMYKLSHPLHHIEATSKSAAYRLTVDPSKGTITSVSANVDVTTFDSGNSNRDSHAMEVIDALTYPDVTFTSSSVAQKGDSVTVTGKLTFHGVTKDVVVKGISKWSQKGVELHGGFDISLTEFRVDRPSLLMIPVDDDLKFLVDAAFRWD